LKEIEIENKIIANYFYHNTKIFIKYIKDQENFINLISFYMSPGSNIIKIEMKFEELCSLTLFNQNVKEKIALEKLELKKDILSDFLLAYFTFETKNYNLWNNIWHELYENSTDLTEEEDDFFNDLEKITLKKYQEKILASHITPILENLYVNDKLTFSTEKYYLNKDNILRDFYRETTKNSFSLAIEEFDANVEDYLYELVENDLYDDITRYVTIAVEEINLYQSILFGDKSIFENKSYKNNAKIKFVPMIIKSDIIFCERPYATSIKNAVHSNIFFLIYLKLFAMLLTLKLAS